MTHWINLAWILIAYRGLAGFIKRGVSRMAGYQSGGQGRAGDGRWQRLPAFRRHFIINLVVGLGIALVLHQFHHSSAVLDLEDTVVDWAMRMYRGTAPDEGARPIAFIDIDEATYRQWGEPFFTPRDKLARLIRHAIDGGAEAIVVDIDLSHAAEAGDQVLLDALAPYAAGDDAGSARPPPLILARTFRSPLPGDPSALAEERTSFLDPLAASAPEIFWGAPLFELAGDGRMRRWHLWQAGCSAAGRPVIRASVQLLAKALLDAEPAQRTALGEGFVQLTPEDCTIGTESPDHRDHPDGSGPASVELGDHSISLLPRDTERRILYRIPWHLADGEARPLVDLDGQQVPLLSVRPASAIGDAAGTLSSDWLHGHLVIIGSSYRDSRDLYQTPIGLMPGALVIANAIQSFGSHGEMRAPNLFETLALETVLILIMSYLFARFDSFWGSLLSGTAVILLLLPLSLWLFNTGYWLGFAIPLTAVLIHKSASELEEVLAHHGSKEGSHG